MRIICLLLFAVLLAGCYEPTPGCLDTRATNFDLDADEPCPDDCCVYPELQVRFNSVWVYPDSVAPLRLDTFYIDVAGNPFRFERIRFYWSNLRLELADGQTLLVQDSLDVGIANGGDTTILRVRDDYLLADINRASRTVGLGEIVPTGILTGLQATLGIPAPVNSAVTTSVNTSHPLAPQAGRMNLGAETGYIFAKVEYFQDTTAVDTVPRVINLYGEDFLRELDLPIFAPSPFIDGFDPVLVIEHDVSRWFAGVNVRQADTTTLKQQFVDNLTQSFQLVEVLAQ